LFCISSSFYTFFAKPTTPFLLSTLLEPILRRTAASEGMTKSSHKTVRIVWVSSTISLLTPKGGINFNEVDNPSVPKAMNNYMVSKSGDVFLAAEFAKKSGNDGIPSIVSTHAE
jgi:retinol dehydrogenase-12